MFFFFNDTATTEIYTLSLHDALPICRVRAARQEPVMSRLLQRPAKDDRERRQREHADRGEPRSRFFVGLTEQISRDRKSTRLNSSHANISYAVFCLKKKKKNTWIRCI